MDNKNSKFRIQNSTAGQKLKAGSWKLEAAFTLVELMIVVSILGILAAIVLPEFQGHIQQSKEAAAKANLKVLREAIGRYAADHNGVAPGYFNNNTSLVPSGGVTKTQLVSDANPYLLQLPENPFSDLPALLVIDNATAFPVAPTQTNTYGWIYKPSTKTIKLNWAGNDSNGTSYFNY